MNATPFFASGIPSRRARGALSAFLLGGLLALGGALPAQETTSWAAGEMLTAADGEPGTGTLTLTTTAEQGVYRLPAFGAQVDVKFYLPADARELAVDLEQHDRRQHLFTGQGAQIRGAAFDRQTILFDFQVSEDTDAIAFLEVRPDEEVTTTTLDPLDESVTLSQHGHTIHFQMSGPSVFRVRNNSTYRIVTTMQPNTTARLAISTVKRTGEEIRSLSSEQTEPLEPTSGRRQLPARGEERQMVPRSP